jgi:hypothetical protein
VIYDDDGGCVLLYSGGNWQTPGYGVASAAAPEPAGPWREDPRGGPLVTSASTGLVGPGHCSVLTDDAGRHHLFLHAWDVDSHRRRPHRMSLRVDGNRLSVGPPRPPVEAVPATATRNRRSVPRR